MKDRWKEREKEKREREREWKREGYRESEREKKERKKKDKIPHKRDLKNADAPKWNWNLFQIWETKTSNQFLKLID
jgi:hypothetical protein